MAIAACSPSDGSVSVTSTDSAGVRIVVSHGPDRPLDWTFTPTVRIGGADTGAASFYDIDPGGIAADEAGRIFVLDRQGFRVSAFDDRGHTLWSAGRQGGAPGEFLFPFSMFTRGETVLVVDGGGPELERFRASDGAHVGSERLGRFVPRVVPVTSGLLFEFGDQKGKGDLSRSVLAVESGMDTTRLVTFVIGVQQGVLSFPDCPVKLQMPPVLEPEFLWDGRGDRVAVSRSAAYRVDVFDGGTLAMSVRRDLTPLPATAEIAAAEFPDGFRVNVSKAGLICRIDGEEAVTQIGFADVVPFVRGLTFAPDGTIWVRRNPTREPRGTFDLFSDAGVYIGTLTDAPVPVAFLPNDRILGIEKDELDIERVVVYEVSARP